jgi:hypothetical protein
LCRELLDLARQRGERISFVPLRAVEEFKKDNPDWQKMEPSQAAKKLGAELVIHLDVRSLNLYEPASARMLYRGKANVTVSLGEGNDLKEPLREEYSFLFPSEARGPIPVDDSLVEAAFRRHFVSHVARGLARCFSNHPPSRRLEE